MTTTVYAMFNGMTIVEEQDKAYLQILDTGSQTCVRYELKPIQLLRLAEMCIRAKVLNNNVKS